MTAFPHTFIDRASGEPRGESFPGDRWLSCPSTEEPGLLYRMLTCQSFPSRALAWLAFDLPLGGAAQRFARRFGIDLAECLDAPETLQTARQVFERRIRYWECRPLPLIPLAAVTSPSDARVLVGSLEESSLLLLKGKFFTLGELIGDDRLHWQARFSGGDFAVLRLTLEKYHYNHAPVSGRVVDFYSVDGVFHSCNPGSVVQVGTPCSKNRRVVTIIDTDVDGGSGVGLVAMVEVVALMIGVIEQCYSEERYERPCPIEIGMFVRQGRPKSVFRPGSSTVVLFFEPGRIEFASDIVRNMSRQVPSRFSLGFGKPLVETDIQARSFIAVKQAR